MMQNKENNDNFTHLHVHTDYSLLDGLGKVEDYVMYAKELGMTSIAFTDHGTMAGLVTAYDECKKQGIHFIGGFEAYVAPDGTSRFDKNAKVLQDVDSDKAYNHLIILFKNETGYKNGCVLLTRSNTEGFYYKPRIDFELLKEHHEGLVILSGCVAGAVPQAILNHDLEKAEKIIMEYKEVFGDDYYLEIQDHGLDKEREVITEMLNLSKKCGVKLVATNDCHYVRKEDKEAHQWLVCMQTKKKITDPRRMSYEGYYHLKSKQEMLDLFPYCNEAIYNTNEVADKCNFEFEYGNYRMPKVKIPEEYGNDYFLYLKDEAWKGFEKRYPQGHVRRDSAKQRLSYELSVIKQMDFAKYFLDIRRTIKEAKDNDILVGPGRGSGVGSCMNYCLEITDLDPLKYDLLFERFLNPERVSMPDIDTDFEFLRKDDVIAAEADANGKDCFAKIATIGTMKAKSILKDCVRTSGIENHVAIGAKLAKFITDNHTLHEEWDLNPALRDYVESDEKLQQIWNVALKLENTKKSAGTHACGHITTPVPCEQLFPCRVDAESGYLVCEYNMSQAEHLGNLKKDLLMLRNLTIIDAAQKEIKHRNGTDVPFWTDEILNDKNALEMISRGDTNGVFQLESDGMKQFMRQLKPDCFEDIIAGVALYRPGPMAYIDDYIKNKHYPDEIKYLTPELEPILNSTYGIIIYQEQVIQIVQKLAGFSMGRADLVRKAMGKKKQDIMDEEGPRFIYGDKELGIKGCVNNGISESAAKEIWEQMVEFAKYAFNKSHAAAYAAISMQTAYLKANHPLEFAVGLLTSVMDDSDKLMKYVSDYKKIGIAILPPDVNKSQYGFSIETLPDEKNGIRFGLNAVKGVGESVAQHMQNEREFRTYNGINDFVDRNMNMNKSAFENLIKTGALDSFGYSRKALLNNIEKMISFTRRNSKKKDTNQLTLFDFGIEETQQVYKFEDEEEYSFLELCKKEKEGAGMYLSGHPSSAIEDFAKKNGAVDISDVKSEDSVFENRAEVSIYGVITDIVYKTTKNQKPMMILKVEDATSEISVFVFEKEILKYSKELQEDSLIFLTGRVKDGGEDSCLMLSNVYSLKDTPEILWIGTDSESLSDIEKIVLSFQRNNPGIGDFLYVISKKTKQFKNLGDISVTNDVLNRAQIQFGKENVKITYKKNASR